MINIQTRFIREKNRIYSCILNYFWHLQNCDSARIYMFHSVLDAKREVNSKFSISKASFECFLDKLLSKGQSPMDELDLIMAENNPEEYSNCFAITFDDIYDSVFKNAYPILKARNIPFVIFVSTELVGKVDSYSKNPFITKEHLSQMLHDPLCILGSHGTSHSVFRNLSDEEALEEFKLSKESLESEYGREVKLFAFPYGRRIEVSSSKIKLLATAGYSLGFSALDGSLKQKWISGKWFLPRIRIGENEVR